MASWQIVYLVAQAITVLALVRIGAMAFELLLKTRGLTNYQRGRFLPRIFTIIVAIFLIKDFFWTVLIFWRHLVPDVLNDTLTLAIILAIIQTMAAALLTWMWERMIR